MEEADSEIVFRSGPGRPKQKTFPDRRHRAKSRRSTDFRRSSRQSTLTQLDYCSPTPRDRSYSADRSNNDEEYVEQGPGRKRRRTGDRKRKQTTLTQMYSFEGVLSDDEAMQWDEVNYKGLEGRQPGPPVIQGQQVQSSCRMQPRPEVVHDPEMQAKVKGCESADVPSTPIKQTFRDEIPSSQTPQSIFFSHRRPKVLPDTQCTPSKLRSTDGEIQQSPEVVPGSPVERRAPLLKHTSTLPDSEDEADEIIHDTQSTTKAEYAHTHLSTETQQNHLSTQRPTQATYLSSYDPAFDPACSALDRDAARFLQTQLLQGVMESPAKFNDHEKENSRSSVELPFSTAPEPRQERWRPPQIPECDPNRDDEDEEGDDSWADAVSIRSQSPSRRNRHEEENIAQVPAGIEAVDLTSTPPVPPSISSSRSPTPDRLGDSRDQVPSSPPMPKVIPSSQATTVDGTQVSLSHLKNSSRHRKQRSEPKINPKNGSSSPLPSDQSSPPPTHIKGAQDRRSSFSLYTSDSAYAYNEDDDDHRYVEGHDKENDPLRRAGRRLKRANEILPDSLLDFSIPHLLGTQGSAKGIDYSLPPPSSNWRSKIRRHD